jgi:hypothetical protein
MLAALLAIVPLASCLAADLTLVLDEQSPAYNDFVAQLRIANAAAHRLTQGKINTVGVDALATLNLARADTGGDADSVLTGVRTRGMRRTAPADDAIAKSASSLPATGQSDTGVLVAVGMRAARAVVDRNGNEPVLLGLRGRL